MYIDSKEPDTTNLHYLKHVAKVNNGTFTVQSNQEEDYTLIYQGAVAEGSNQLLLAFPDGRRG